MFRDPLDTQRGSFSCDDTASVTLPDLPDEVGHFFASRFETTASVDICTIRYALVGGLGGAELRCASYLEHTAVLFKTTSSRPPDRFPDDAIRLNIDGTEDLDDGLRVISYDVEGGQPIMRLDPGEYLYVAVEMVATPDNATMCISSCSAGDFDPETTWLSNSDSEPFAWETLQASSGLDSYYLFLLDVRPPDDTVERPCPGG
jgi:hypothetical protein